MTRYIAALLFAASVLMPQAAFASSADDTADAPPKKVFGPGDFDILLAAGLGAFIYPHVEPNVDIGIIPLSHDLTLSIGAGADFGYCALCGLVSATSSASISASTISPRGRVNLHLGTLDGLIPTTMDKYTLDSYVGLFAGPQFYRWRFDSSSGNLKSDTTTFILGPLFGVRVGFAHNHLLLFGEYRYGVEVGFTTVSVTDQNGNTYDATSGFSRGGNDFVLGVGLRL